MKVAESGAGQAPGSQISSPIIQVAFEAHISHSIIRSQVPILGLLKLQEDEANQKAAQDTDKSAQHWRQRGSDS